MKRHKIRKRNKAVFSVKRRFKRLIKDRRTKTILIAVLVVLLSGITYAQAKHAGTSGFGYDSGSGYRGMSLEKTFFKKAHAIMANQFALGLSQKQVESVRDLKLGVKKDLINFGAQTDIIKLDIQNKLKNRPVNVGDVNELLDEKYAIQKNESRKIIEAYAQLKSVLTDEQYAKMYELRRG